MKDKIVDTGQRLWRGFLSFTPGQKAVTIAAVLALTLGGYFFSTWASKPDYAPLFTNLAPADASAIVDKLNANKTPYQLAANGTEILVPQKQVYALRLSMSSAGLPNSGSTGYSLLDSEGITTSEFKQHVDYQRALEGELSKTIKSINGVGDAQVHLAIPQQNVFDDGTQKATASVMLTTVPGTTLASGQIQSIINLVSSSVPGLAADQVTVSDTVKGVLSANGTAAAGGSSDQTTQTQQYETKLSTDAQAMIDKLVGAGHAQVSIHADLDFDRTTISSHNYSYPTSLPPLSEQSAGESLGAGASGTGGVVGQNTNPAVAGSSGSPTASGYAKNNVTRDYAINEQNESRTVAPGSVRRLTAAVVLDKATAAQLDPAKIKALVANAIGLDSKRGDSIEVQTLAFDTADAGAAAKAAKAADAAANSAKSKAELISMAKTGGVVLLVIIVGVVTLIASKRRKGEEPEDDLDTFLATLRNDPNALPPAPTDIVPPKSRDVQQNEMRQQQLTEMADDDPAEVARLLRNWLNSKDG